MKTSTTVFKAALLAAALGLSACSIFKPDAAGPAASRTTIRA